MDILRSPFARDIPKVFISRDSAGELILVGYYASVIKEFAQRHQLTLQMEYSANYRVSEVQRKIEAGHYNISIQGAFYNNLFANISFSYPLEWSRVCIMVPTEDKLPDYWHVVWPFDLYIWIVLGVSVIYVAALMTVLKHPSTSIAGNLPYSLALLQFSANMQLDRVTSSLRLIIFYLLLITLGFILSSYYCSYLTAYNMRPIFQPFMKTVEDLVNANFKVIATSPNLEELRNNKYVDLSRLEPLFKESHPNELISNFKSVNRSFAYLISLDEWQFINMLQRSLIQPLFQLSDICFGDVLIAYPISQNWHLTNILNLFILLTKESGLWDQWREEAFLAAIKSNYYKTFTDDYPCVALNIDSFRIAWIVLFAGVALSSCCLLSELWWHRKKL